MLTRRQILKVGVAGAALLLFPMGCERHRFIRPADELDLGPVKELLYSRVHIPEKAVLVYRDVDGWAGLSTRCSYHGCDLTYQEPVLLCPCCRTRFGLDGIPYPNSVAKRPLPWIDLYYRDGHLYGNPGVVRPAKFRFTTPEIEEAMRKLRAEVHIEQLADELHVPEFLKGKGDEEPGVMFLEDDANLIHELNMIK